jgi:selenocysteine lyase/cysteine desulfurase
MASTRDTHDDPNAGARSTIRGFVHARSSDRVVLAPDTASAVCVVTDAAPGESVVLDLEAELTGGRHAGVPGSRVVPAHVDLTTTMAALERELAAWPTALLVVPAVARTTGEVLPLSKLAAMAHRHHARLLVDGTELAARRVINLTSHGADYVVLAGRQPAGNGPAAVVGRADWMTGVSDSTADPAALRGVAQACEAVADLGFEWIGLHEQALSDVLDEALGRLPGTRRLQLWADVTDRVGIASVAVAGRDDPVRLRWGFGTGHNELALQLDSLADVVFEQEKS